MYRTYFMGQPLSEHQTWQEAASELLKRGFAIFVHNTIFTLLPGVMIK
jgi:hypothetical protein